MRSGVSSPYPLTQNSELITQHFFEWRRGWAFEVAFAGTVHAPTEGASPLVGSPRGGHIPPRSPFRIPPSDLSYSYITLSPLTLALTFHVFTWRRGWDSNPRSHCWDACFPSMSIRPLSHLSGPILRGGILTRGPVTSKVSANGRRLELGLFSSSRLSGFLVGRN